MESIDQHSTVDAFSTLDPINLQKLGLFHHWTITECVNYPRMRSCLISSSLSLRLSPKKCLQIILIVVKLQTTWYNGCHFLKNVDTFVIVGLVFSVLLYLDKPITLRPRGKGELPHKKDGGARRTFQGLKMRFWYLLGCVSSARACQVPFRVLSRKKYDRRISDNQLIANFVSFTIVFISSKNYESVS